MFGFLDAEEARRMMAVGAVVVDVRTQEEWDQGHAANTIWVPLHDLADHLAELPQSVPLLQVCRSGARSGQATAYLRNQGIDAHNLGPWQRTPEV